MSNILFPHLVKKIRISQRETQILYLLGGKYIFKLILHIEMFEMCHISMYVKLPLESWYTHTHHFSSVNYESFYNRVTLVNPD